MTAAADKLDVVRRVNDLWLAGDVEGALALFHPEAVIDMTVRPDGQIYTGPNGMYQAMRVWIESWDDYDFANEEYADAGEDRVLVLWRERGRGKGSDIEVELVGGSVWKVREGLVTYVKPFIERGAAIAAAGLTDFDG
jgi:ketosteroid isomerase-like protein